jgi:hypothetical protein
MYLGNIDLGLKGTAQLVVAPEHTALSARRTIVAQGRVCRTATH